VTRFVYLESTVYLKDPDSLFGGDWEHRATPDNANAVGIYYLADEGAPEPRHAQPGDAGVDLYLTENTEIMSGCRKLLPTGVRVAIPRGTVGLVTPRSGLAIKYGLTIVNSPGIIDSGYRGEIKVIAQNSGFETINLLAGERIAQMIVIPFYQQVWIKADELPESARGEDGFGSTGT